MELTNKKFTNKKFTNRRKIKDLLIIYVKEYAKQIYDKKMHLKIINDFDLDVSSSVIYNKILKSELSDKIKKDIEDNKDVFIEELKDFIKEKLIINYFSCAKNINYYIAKTLLIDKGIHFFNELLDINEDKFPLYTGRFKDYKASEEQKEYIKKNTKKKIENEKELSAREAGIIIKCLLNKNRIKPFYYYYYIQ